MAPIKKIRNLFHRDKEKDMDPDCPLSDYVLKTESSSNNQITHSTLSIETKEDLEGLLQSDQYELSYLRRNYLMFKVKTVIRSHNWAYDHPIRRYLWNYMCKHQSAEKRIDGFYQQMIKESLGEDIEPQSLPSFVDPAYCLNYDLNPIGKKALRRVLCIISNVYPAVTYSPIIYPLVSLFLHFMREDEAYYSIADLISKLDFIPQTRMAHEVKAYVMLKLTKKFAKPFYQKLQNEIKEMETPHKIFIRWQWWLFKGYSLDYLVRMVDCFLLDGSKALYRFALTTLLWYNKSPTFEKEVFSGLEMTEKLVYFCQEQKDSVDKLIKDSYNIRGLSKSYINKKAQKAMIILKIDSDPRSFLSLNDDGSSSVRQYRDLPPVGHLETEIIGTKEIERLWSWIPIRFTTLVPHLVYSTNEDGSSLTAFFRKVDPWEPTILLIKASTDEVFGAFCSESWSKRFDEAGNRRNFFGTGESFLFTLKPVIKCYPWASLDGEVTAQTAHLIMSAQNDFICLGGGGGAGLFLDNNLGDGRTQTCETFNNPPLCSEEYFHCKIVEVLAFKEKEMN